MQYEGHRLRHEFKYYISEETYRILRPRFCQLLNPDPNMPDEEGYLISSLYFDDMMQSALKEKINGTRFRKKFRIRVYEREDSVIKLECKSKYDSFIAKESASLSRLEYDSLLAGDYDFLLGRKERVCRELYAYYKTRLLRPVTVVEYRREAYILEQGNVRITFDKDLSASIYDVDMFSEECIMSEVLPRGMMVLEVKYDDYIPAFVWQLIQTQSANKCAISKYVMCRNKNRRVRQR